MSPTAGSHVKPTAATTMERLGRKQQKQLPILHITWNLLAPDLGGEKTIFHLFCFKQPMEIPQGFYLHMFIACGQLVSTGRQAFFT